ncbi:unnamed protein product (macronuclear) [Paramecium tetraurelia]|uniref:Uncharacterized protein n=1 Tax=Paramecium tetraurelia TaxID=5888 RepID=A0BRA1_PARTE|nr:uncharacterized protein GSPATT00031299001 [Paramecium tetraurelia]CAK61068.1 unnamed protein product [Paramecium tetraurelia]|eukprot:XP_001428466.1 hypothetical protein (macronuclear) [Paramecium tetraurelia strain d4-2]
MTMNGTCLDVQYYYDGLQGEKLEIPYRNKLNKLDEGFEEAFELISPIQELKNIDASMLKKVFFNLIEIFYWSANFGLFFDPLQSCLLYYKEEEQFVLLPTFTLMTRHLFQSKASSLLEKFIEFRFKLYQNATFNFLYRFYLKFLNPIKNTDEDFSFFEEYFIKEPEIQDLEPQFPNNQQYRGADYLYKDQRFQKKLARTRFKQTMLLYQLQNNEELKMLFKEFSRKDDELITQQKDAQNLLQLQFINMTQFFSKLPKEINSNSYEIFGKFMNSMYEHLKSKNTDENKIDMAPYSKVASNQHRIEIFSKPETKDQFQFNWSSSINRINRQIVDQRTQQMIQEDLKIPYTMTFKESSASNQANSQYDSVIIMKTSISEIQFSIDTADDIIYLANMLIREPTPMNIYIDQSRKLTISTTIQTACPMGIFKICIRIFDMFQIYFHMILEFYHQIILIGKPVNEKKYQAFVNEIQHYILDYEIDFDELMKKVDPIQVNKQ